MSWNTQCSRQWSSWSRSSCRKLLKKFKLGLRFLFEKYSSVEELGQAKYWLRMVEVVEVVEDG